MDFVCAYVSAVNGALFSSPKLRDVSAGRCPDVTCDHYSHASLNDGYTFCEMRR